MRRLVPYAERLSVHPDGSHAVIVLLIRLEPGRNTDGLLICVVTVGVTLGKACNAMVD